MSFERVALQLSKSRFANLTGMFLLLFHEVPIYHTPPELSSIALGGRVVSVSDEFFAEAYHLLLVEVRILANRFRNLNSLITASVFSERSVWTKRCAV